MGTMTELFDLKTRPHFPDKNEWNTRYSHIERNKENKKWYLENKVKNCNDSKKLDNE